MHAFTGTWRLLRLALRRDRVKLPIILLILGFVFYSSAQATVDFYGKTQADQIAYAAANAPSVVARVFNGPIAGPSIGAVVMNETYVFTALTLAFVTAMTVVRHTRQNEEFGRSELIESGIVARHASLAAAMIVATLASIMFGLLAYASLLGLDLPKDGALAVGLSFTGTGLVFAAIAAVCSQLADSARGANSFSALIIGVAFLLRGLGDGMGTIVENGLAVRSAWPTWLSPFGWGHLMHPFTDLRLWILALFGGLFLIAISTAVIFMARRDIGMGMIATRLGRARAQKKLLSPIGLARRLQRNTLIGWAVTIIVLGASYGLTIKEFSKLIAENEEFREAFALTGSTNIEKFFVAFLIMFQGLAIGGYAIQSLLRLRAEEANGQLESVLGTSVGRTRWQLSHISYSVFGVLLLASLSGLSFGGTYIASIGKPWGELWTVLGASLVSVVPVLALMGFVILVIALWPRLAIAIAWASFAGCMLILQLGELLKLPQWVMNISPFGHTPLMPADSFELTPVLWLLVAGFAFVAAALTWFNRRDIVTA